MAIHTIKKTKTYATDGDYALCRCGNSQNKPHLLCDGTHMVGFNGTETASKETYLQQAICYEGLSMNLLDACDLCAAV